MHKFTAFDMRLYDDVYRTAYTNKIPICIHIVATNVISTGSTINHDNECT